MFTIEVLRALHVTGLVMAVLGLGGAFVHAMNGGTRQTNKFRVGIALTHGLGLTLALIAGLMMLGEVGATFTNGWVLAKFGIWLYWGLVLSLTFRRPQMAKVGWWIIPVTALAAVWLAHIKPF